MATSPVDRALEAFAVELAQWRTGRGLSKKRLAAEMGFDPSYLSHVEGGRHRPTESFAERAEAVLRTGGAIWRSYLAYAQLRSRRELPVRPHQSPDASPRWLPPGSGVVIESELATLTYTDDAYHCVIRRDLYNAGTEPITRYPVRVSVDRYPGNPGWSNRYYHEHPLTIEELNFSAALGTAPGEPMDWHAAHSRDSYQKIVLLFGSGDSRFPLYPTQRATITYSYRVTSAKWGQWFEREIRMPTQRLSVCMRFPAAASAVVWGTHSSLTTDSPLSTPVVESVDGELATFRWSTDDPPLRSRFRLQWRFREPAGARADLSHADLSHAT